MVAALVLWTGILWGCAPAPTPAVSATQARSPAETGSATDHPGATQARTYVIAAIEANDEANRALRRAQHERALRRAEEAVELDPSFPDAHVTRAAILTRLGRFADAADALGDALDADPGFAEAALFRGILLERAGQPGAAHAQLLAAAERLREDVSGPGAPPHKQVHLAMAEYLLQGPGPAVKRLQRVLASNPDYMTASRLLAQLMNTTRAEFIAQFDMRPAPPGGAASTAEGEQGNG